MQRKTKNNLVVLVIVLLILIIIILFLSLYNKSNEILEKKEVPVHLEISNITGLKVENETLDFGRIIRGSSAHKLLTFENNYEFPISVDVSVEGNVSKYLIYEPFFRLESGEKKQEGIETIVFGDDPLGNYTGIMTVIFKRAK